MSKRNNKNIVDRTVGSTRGAKAVGLALNENLSRDVYAAKEFLEKWLRENTYVLHINRGRIGFSRMCINLIEVGLLHYKEHYSGLDYGLLSRPKSRRSK